MPYADRKLRDERRMRRIDPLAEPTEKSAEPAGGGQLIGPAFGLLQEVPASVQVAGGKAYLSAEDLRRLLEKEFSEPVNRFSVSADSALRTSTQFDDMNYYAPTPAEVQRVIDKSATTRTAWDAEIFDCEDFAYTLRAEFARNRYDDRAKDAPFAVGMLWGESTKSQSHVVNILAVYEDGRIKVKLIDGSRNKVVMSAADGWRVVDFIVI